MTSTQNSSQNKSFWQKINTTSTIHLSFTNPQITDPILKPSENQEPSPNSAKNLDSDKPKVDGSQIQCHGESGQQNSGNKMNEGQMEKVGNQELHHSNLEQSNKIDLAVCIYGKLFENSNNGYVWKTKWYLPPIMVKLKHESPGIQKLLQKLYFELYVIEPTKQQNKFQVVLGCIRGASKKKIINGNCEFKNIKIHSEVQGRKFKLLLVASFSNEENPKTKEYFQIYISPQITVYNQSKLLQLDKHDMISVYFQMFDPQELIKQTPKIRTDKIESPQKVFENYLFKKVPKIKNVFYLAIKFPQVVEIYVNNSMYIVDGQLKKGFTEQISESINLPEQSEPLNMICNYINPNGKLIMKINCSPNDINFFINKSFTKQLCIVVGEDIVVPPTFTKITDIEALRKDYTDYCLNLHTQIDHHVQEDAQGVASDYDNSDSSDDGNSYNENDDKKLRKKKNNKKRDQKRYVPNRSIKVSIPDAQRSAARNTRSKRKDGSDNEESLYDDQNMLMDQDDEDRPTKKTRSSLADRRKKQFKLKDKIDEKSQHHDHIFHKASNSSWDANKTSQHPSMMRNMQMIDPTQLLSSQLMGAPGGFQIAGFPQMQMPGNNVMPQAMFMPQMIPVPIDNRKPQNISSGTDKDKNKTPNQPQIGSNMGQIGQFAMPIMMTNDMMKGLIGNNPQGLGMINGLPPGAAISMIPPQMAAQMNAMSQQSQKLQTKSSQDKSDDSQANDIKKAMEMMYSQMPMYAIGGNNPMMAMMQPGSDNNSMSKVSQSMMPSMIATSLPGNLSQNGPFMLLSNSQLVPPTVMSQRPSNPTPSNISFQQKKKEASQQSQDKKQDKKVPQTPYSSYHQHMSDTSSNKGQPQMTSTQQPAFAIMNPNNANNLQQTLNAYDQLSGFQNSAMAQMMPQMGQFPNQMKMGMMMNPYAAFSGQTQSGGQTNPSMQQMMGFASGPMGSSGFGAQSPYTFIGMPSKAPGNDQEVNKNKQSQHKQDEKLKHSSVDKKQMQQPQIGFPMMQPGGFYMPAMGGTQNNGQIQMAMQSMPMMASNGTFAFPSSMMPQTGQQSSTSQNWEGDQGFLQMQGMASLAGMPGMQGIQGLQGLSGLPTGMQGVPMMNINGQMGIPAQFLASQPGAHLLQSRTSQPQQNQSFNNFSDKKKKQDKK